jgi:hypothetical protein
MAEPLELYDELTRWIDELAGRRQVPQPPLRSLRALQRHLLIRNPTGQSSRRQRVRFG